jgi:D-beta-D-heptose 7-phosphate kinase/D-beta-D-heptose 1-phosphate adenosyltransferase
MVNGNFFTSITAIGEEILKLLDCEAALVVREEQEIAICTKDGVQRTLQIGVSNSFSPAGVQDTVCGTFALALAAGADYENAAILASRAMKVVLSKEGMATITIGELHE